MINLLIDDFVAPIMVANGFHRNKFTWNRKIKESDIIHVLNVQQSRWNDADSKNITINIGVCITKMWEIYSGKERLPAIVGTSYCFPCLRVGQLLGEGPLRNRKDVWWKLHTQDDINVVAIQLQNVLNDNCLLFLNRLDSYHTILDLAKDPMLHRFPAERLLYAILQSLAGHYEDANKNLNEILENPRLEVWHERVKDILDRLFKM